MNLAKLSAIPARIIFLLVAVAAVQYYGDVNKEGDLLLPPTIIPAKAVRLSDLGLDSAAASAMWVYTIQQVTEHADKLPELIENVTEIDPKFSYPYAFAALTVPAFSYPRFPEKAVEIAQRGIRDADSDWRIPYYLATTYHIFFKDREKAAYYFDIASDTPGAPDKIKLISGLYGTAPNIREQTRQIWLTIYETSNDETVKERAKNYLIQLDILDALDKAISLYVQKFHKYPVTVEDLVSGRIIKEVPISPFNSKYYIENGRIFVR